MNKKNNLDNEFSHPQKARITFTDSVSIKSNLSEIGVKLPTNHLFLDLTKVGTLCIWYQRLLKLIEKFTLFLRICSIKFIQHP
jgi:hypothetical protein